MRATVIRFPAPAVAFWRPPVDPSTPAGQKTLAAERYLRGDISEEQLERVYRELDGCDTTGRKEH